MWSGTRDQAALLSGLRPEVQVVVRAMLLVVESMERIFPANTRTLLAPVCQMLHRMRALNYGDANGISAACLQALDGIDAILGLLSSAPPDVPFSVPVTHPAFVAVCSVQGGLSRCVTHMHVCVCSHDACTYKPGFVTLLFCTS